MYGNNVLLLTAIWESVGGTRSVLAMKLGTHTDTVVTGYYSVSAVSSPDESTRINSWEFERGWFWDWPFVIQYGSKVRNLQKKMRIQSEELLMKGS